MRLEGPVGAKGEGPSSGKGATGVAAAVVTVGEGIRIRRVTWLLAQTMTRKENKRKPNHRKLNKLKKD